MDAPNGFAVFAAMLGVDASVLRVVARPWIEDSQTPSISIEHFARRVSDALAVASQLNNTNAWEQAITNALPPDEVPRTIPTAGVPRPADTDDKQES